MPAVTRRKLSAQPNAGMPREVGGRSMYMASPEYMATYARHLIHAGAKVLGGCCGTTPEHIKAICEGIRPLNPRLSVERGASGVERSASGAERGVLVETRSTLNAQRPAPFGERSRFAARIAAGEVGTLVEVGAPRGGQAGRRVTAGW